MYVSNYQETKGDKNEVNFTFQSHDSPTISH